MDRHLKQIADLDVDPINSVQFSNHTGYETFGNAGVLDGDGLNTLIDGLLANGIHQYTHVLTGYIGSVTFLRTVVDCLKKLRAHNPQLAFFCDPVMVRWAPLHRGEESAPAGPPATIFASLLRTSLERAHVHTLCTPPLLPSPRARTQGDDGSLYVPKELIPVYRDEVAPLASVLTPNTFEAEMLTGVKIEDEASALLACHVLHERGTETVILTSCEFAS